MIPLKSTEEVEIMHQGGKKLAGVVKQVLAKIEPGMRLKEIDRLVDHLIDEEGGKPSFKTVEDYRWASCLNVNQGVVHGIPNDYSLKEDDLFSVDIGMFYQGLHTDMARTLWVRKARNEKFLEAGKKALKKATKAAKPGNRVGHLSQAIEVEIRKYGFCPVEALVGHGVGKKLHESPAIPCCLKGKIEKTETLRAGMTLAIEVIYTQKTPGIVVKEDEWTVETDDGQLAGLFEDTVAVTSKGPLVLTKF